MILSPARWFISGLALVALSCTALAVDDELAATARAAVKEPAPTKGLQMSYGPVLSYSVQLRPPGEQTPSNPPTWIAGKGIVVKLGSADEASVCFDPETLRMAAGWTGGFLNLQHTNIGTYKGDGTGAAEIVGNPLFQTEAGPGWSTDGSFADPRPDKHGNLPKEHGRFRGFYLHGESVIFSYEAEGCQILETAELRRSEKGLVIARRFSLGPSAKPLWLQAAGIRAKIDLVSSLNIDQRTEAGFQPPAEVEWSRTASGGSVLAVLISPHLQPVDFEVLVLSRPDGVPAAVPVMAPSATSAPLTDLCHGGPVRWPAVNDLTATRATTSEPYVLDSIPLPEANPWKSWMRLSAIDFFPDGRAAVATLNGDVWLVSGLDAELQHVTWKRFAVGLHQPMGLKIVEGKIYVHGKDQITRLHDLNGDDEADYYECFNNDRAVAPGYHTFAFDLQTDHSGSFYYAVGGQQLGTDRPWHSCLVKVSRDGSTSEILATGFRAPNGLALGPNDEITVSENQGSWIPSSKISRVRRGGYYGFVADPKIEPTAVAPPSFDPPLCYIPMTIDSSSSGEVWAISDKWGPLGGHLLQTSFGKAALMWVLQEEVEGVPQGAVVAMPGRFDSGLMRARFNPLDGQLYVVGLNGWQSNAVKDGCFQRVRFTGKSAYLPIGMKTEKDQLSFSFSEPLDPASAEDPQNYAIEQWNYKWWSTYGSPDFSVANPAKKGRDTAEIDAVKLSADGKTVTLHIPGLHPSMQFLVKLNLQAADGTKIEREIAGTINRVPVR